MTISSQPDDDAVELAQALMANITGRLEDLAVTACDHQRQTAPSNELADGLRRVMILAEAHRELLRPPESQAG